jgi:hypothetical protein
MVQVAFDAFTQMANAKESKQVAPDRYTFNSLITVSGALVEQ